MDAERGAESTHLAEDGCAMPSRCDKVGEAAGEVPGDPEADELGIFEDRVAHVVSNIFREILKARAIARAGECLAHGFLGNAVVEGIPASTTLPVAFGGLTLVAAEVLVQSHSRILATTNVHVKCSRTRS